MAAVANTDFGKEGIEGMREDTLTAVVDTHATGRSSVQRRYYVAFRSAQVAQVVDQDRPFQVTRHSSSVL